MKKVENNSFMRRTPVAVHTSGAKPFSHTHMRHTLHVKYRVPRASGFLAVLVDIHQHQQHGDGSAGGPNPALNRALHEKLVERTRPHRPSSRCRNSTNRKSSISRSRPMGGLNQLLSKMMKMMMMMMRKIISRGRLRQ